MSRIARRKKIIITAFFNFGIYFPLFRQGRIPQGGTILIFAF
jgi:hypothetical protein